MFNALKEKIINTKAEIGIIGLGYVGLPLAAEFAKAGFHVTGFEIDDSRVRSISKGMSYINDVKSEDVAFLVKSKRLSATADFKKIRRMDIIITCVPTPLRKSKDPDVSFIIGATNSIRSNIRKGQLIVLESTTYPGTTKELVMPLLEKKGFLCGRDFFLAFSPERVDPGNKKFSIANTPKVVGGVTRTCCILAELLYRTITVKVLPVSSTEAAEMVKLLENTFRAVNIALVNEVALMCDRLGLDVWEIIDAAASKPFGFIPFYPGPGIGGHCIPLDPHYLSWKLKTLNFYSRFIELAGEMNSRMPEYVVEKIVSSLNNKSKSVRGARILIVGVAYKKDVSDVRESPAIDVINLLVKKGARLNYFDLHVPYLHLDGKRLVSIKNLHSLSKFDAVVIVTDHSDVDYHRIVKDSAMVIDSRNATRGIKSDTIIKL